MWVGTRRYRDSVSTEVLVALIAFGGVAVAQVIAFSVSRLNANDLRVNVDREIDILRKLNPSSPQATALSVHVSERIDELISQNERRSESRLWQGLFKWGVAAAIYAIYVWYRHGIPADLQLPVWVVFVGLLATAMVTLVTSAYVLFWSTRARIAETRLWWSKRRLTKIVRGGRADITESRKLTTAVRTILVPRAEELKQQVGEEGWNTFIGLLEESERSANEAAESLDQGEKTLREISGRNAPRLGG